MANKLASKYDLIASYGKMVMLNINGEAQGAYYLVERISDEFLDVNSPYRSMPNYQILVTGQEIGK